MAFVKSNVITKALGAEANQLEVYIFDMYFVLFEIRSFQ